MPDGKPALPAANIEIECAVEAGAWAPEETLQRLAEEAVAAAVAETGATDALTLSILFTGDEEVQALNARFRGKDKPTNVLSFPAPAAMAPPGEPRHLGDIALAYGTVAREAVVEGKSFEHHLTHLVIHGFLHLRGYDHESPRDADEMEKLERRILQSLAIGDPYA